jgi:hypothetical protein
MRYKNNEIKKLKDGRQVFRTRIPKQIEQRDTDIFVATQTGDRLDTLASQYYNDSRLWWIIADANNIHNALIGIDEGTILRIPTHFLEIINDY